MASTDQPMIYVIPSGATTNANYIDMCQSGIFWHLTDYIQNSYLFRTELSSPAALNATSIDGRNYMFPLISSATRLSLLYRQDWIENLAAKGIEAKVPTSTEEQQTAWANERNNVMTNMLPRRIVGIDYGGEKTAKQIRNQEILDMNEENEQYAVVDASAPYMNTDLRNAQYQIATIISDARVKYMVGQLDKDGFIAETNRWLAEGGQEIVAASNAAYQASK